MNEDLKFNDNLNYDFVKRHGRRGWPFDAVVTDADIQEALAVFVVIDPNVRKAILGVKGQPKTAWLRERGEWRQTEYIVGKK